MSDKRWLRSVGVAIAVAVILVTVVVVSAEVPQQINYQGLLTDTGGQPLQGSYGVTFRIWDAASGGSQLWQETQTVSTDTNGVLSVILGSSVPINVSFGGARWLELSIEDEILLPRREMVSVASAFNAMNSDSLGGMHSSSYSLVGHTHDDRYYTEAELATPGTLNTGSNPMDWTKLKGVPAGFADGTDDAGGAGDGYSLDAADGSPTDVVYVDNSGNVGVGTGSPERLLHIIDGSAGAVTADAGSEIVIEDDHDAAINFLSPSAYAQGLRFGDPANPATGWLMYDHNVDMMRLGVGGDNKLAILNDGKIGIGTLNPAGELSLAKNANDWVTIEIDNPNAGSNSAEGIVFNDENGGVAGLMAYDDGATYASAMAMYNNRPAGNLRFNTGGLERMRIANSGAVGIGATSPSARLHVNGSDVTLLMLDSPASYQSELSFANAGTRKWSWYIPGGGSNFSLYHNLAPFQNYVTFNGTDGNIYIAPSGGNVGIGTTTPSEKLQVAGTVRVVNTYDGPNAFFQNLHATGTGLLAAGNNQSGVYLVGGSGLAGTGSRFGVYGRAALSGNDNQAGGYFANGYGDYAYVAYRTGGGQSYKIFGSGGTATVMPTSGGSVSLVCPESPEAWIEDYGSGEIKSGACHVDLDPTFLECITVDGANPVKIFVQLTAPLEQQFYVKKGTTGFDVIVVGSGSGEAGATFDFKVVGRWKGWEGVRFAKGAGPAEAVQMPEDGSQ